MKNKNSKQKDLVNKDLCCAIKNESKSNGMKSGIIAALVPHIGCILFLVLTLLGISAGAVYIKQFLMMWWAFPVLILFSFALAGLSSYLYLKRNCCANKAKYLSILFGSVIAINALLFFVIFPWAANVSGQSSSNVTGLSEMTLAVAIPCPGHASLIIDELKKSGADSVSFNLPNLFTIKYDSSKVDKSQILGLDIFKTYKAVAK